MAPCDPPQAFFPLKSRIFRTVLCINPRRAGVLFTHPFMREHTQQGLRGEHTHEVSSAVSLYEQRIPAIPLGLTVLFPGQRGAGSEGAGEAGAEP